MICIIGVQALPRRPPVVVLGDAVIRSGAISFRLLLLLPLGDDHVMGIRADVDDVEEVIVGVIVLVAASIMMAFCYVVAVDS